MNSIPGLEYAECCRNCYYRETICEDVLICGYPELETDIPILDCHVCINFRFQWEVDK